MSDPVLYLRHLSIRAMSPFFRSYVPVFPLPFFRLSPFFRSVPVFPLSPFFRAGVAVGGDYKQPGGNGKVIARSSDGGRTWIQPEGRGPMGFRSAVVYLPDRTRPTLVAVGPSGADASGDDGRNWFPLSDTGAHAVDAAESNSGWAVGENGTILRFKITPDAVPLK